MMRNDMTYHWRSGFSTNNTSDEIIESTFATIPLAYTHKSLKLHLRHEIYEKGYDTGNHRHKDFYALYIVQGGKGIHIINQHPYTITRGDVYLMPPGASHAYRDYQRLSIDGCYFQPQLFEHAELAALHSLAGFWKLLITLPFHDLSIEPTVHENKPSIQQTFQEDQRLHLPPEHHHELDVLLNELFTEFTGQTLDAFVLTRHLFFQILVYLARWQSEQMNKGSNLSIQSRDSIAEKNRNVHKNEKVNRYRDIADIVRLCEEHYNEPLSVPQLAALIFLSPGHFSELFVRHVGMTPATYIRRLRMERAQTLLRTTRLSSTAIAHQVGLRDSAQLSRTFRLVFGLSPTAYRARYSTK